MSRTHPQKSGNPSINTDVPEAGTSVGHRRWVRKDTPALTRQPEQRPPRLPALMPRLCPARSELCSGVPSLFDKKLKESRGHGGNYDIFRSPSTAHSHQTGTRCTDAGPARGRISFNAGNKFRLLRPPSGALSSPGVPARREAAVCAQCRLPRTLKISCPFAHDGFPER